MQFRYSFKQMESSAPLISFIEPKLKEKIDKYVTKPVDIHVTFKVDASSHIVHCSFAGGDNYKFEVEHKTGDMYGAIAQVVTKFENQLKKHKDKLKSHKGHATGFAKVMQFEPKDEKTVVGSDAVDAEDIIRYERAMQKKRVNS